MSAFFQTIEAGKETPTVNDSIIRTYFERPIELDNKKKYEMALVSFNTYRSYTNINEKITFSGIVLTLVQSITPFTSKKEHTK